MGCSTEVSFCLRLQEGLEQALKAYRPAKYWISTFGKIIKSLSFVAQPDPLSGEISIELTSKKGTTLTLIELLKSISELSQHFKLLILIDEFQDIIDVTDLQGLLRSHLQTLKNTPILMLGSKKQLLLKMFTNNNSPFFQFADEYVLKPIPVTEWTPYFSERLKEVHSSISNEALEKICNLAMNVPNNICEIGAFLQDYYPKTKVTIENIMPILSHLLDRKAETFKQQILLLSENERKICYYIAKQKYVINLMSKDFSQNSGITPSGVKKSVNKLFNLGYLEEEDQGYRIANPLLGLYLQYRIY
jgi:hypothetical protein